MCGWPAARIMTPYTIPFTCLQSYIFVIKNTKMFVSTLLIPAPTATTKTQGPSITSTNNAPQSPLMVHITADHHDIHDLTSQSGNITVTIPGVLGSPGSTNSPGRGGMYSARRTSLMMRGSPLASSLPGLSTPKANGSSSLATTTTHSLPTSNSNEPLMGSPSQIGSGRPKRGQVALFNNNVGTPTHHGSGGGGPMTPTGLHNASSHTAVSSHGDLSERSDSPEFGDRANAGSIASNHGARGTPTHAAHRPSIVGNHNNNNNSGNVMSPRAVWMPTKQATGARAAAAVMAAARQTEQQQRSSTPTQSAAAAATAAAAVMAGVSAVAAASVAIIARNGSTPPPPPPPSSSPTAATTTTTTEKHHRMAITTSNASTSAHPSIATPLHPLSSPSMTAGSNGMLNISVPPTLACASPPGPTPAASSLNHGIHAHGTLRPTLSTLHGHHSFGASDLHSNGFSSSPPPQPSPSGIRPSQLSQVFLTQTPDATLTTVGDNSNPTTVISRSTSPQHLTGFNHNNNNHHDSSMVPLIAPVPVRPTLAMHMASASASTSTSSGAASRYVV
jgi:hypothetical protein